jgi:5'-3' exonuclease
MNNIVLVDTSYTSFYRFFATLRWLSMAEPEMYKKYKDDPTYEWLNNNIFIEKYTKMYLESIIKLLTKKIYNNSHIIFCMDTQQDNIWRNDISCKYKSDRIDLSKKNNFKPVFKYTYSTLIPNIIKNNNNISCIKINELEADDIIAIITKYYHKNNPSKQIYLISGDQDFLQLGRENLFFLNYKNKKKISLTEEQALMSLHRKLLLGDKSDCIASIFPSRFKSKIKKQLLDSIDDFLDYIKSNEDMNNKYNHNKKLIDFNNIPEKYNKLVVDKLVVDKLK